MVEVLAIVLIAVCEKAGSVTRLFVCTESGRPGQIGDGQVAGVKSVSS